MVSNLACCHLFQIFALNMHQNEWFQIRFFKNCLRKSLPSLSPNPSHRFSLDFALNSHTLPVFDSGFALDSRALYALDPGFALNFRLERFVHSPQFRFLDPPPILYHLLFGLHEFETYPLYTVQFLSIVYTMCLVISIISPGEDTFD